MILSINFGLPIYLGSTAQVKRGHALCLRGSDATKFIVMLVAYLFTTASYDVEGWLPGALLFDGLPMFAKLS
jgi:hypothetical protein